MAETKKPTRSKTTAKKTAEEELDEQIAVFEPVPKAVDRVLVHPDGEERTYVQHELSFLSKIKFFKLLAKTVREASEAEGGIALFLQQTLDSISSADSIQANEQFLEVILSLVELAPDFIDEAFVLALNVKPDEQLWVLEALDQIDDETGTDIINTFIAQNGRAIQDFFSKNLSKVGATLQHTMGSEDTEQE